MMTPYRSPLILLLIVVFLAGCGHSAARYRPIVDGEWTAQYESDLIACQALATKRSYANDDVKTHALVGLAAGAVIGGLSEGIEGALGGAAIGGGLGAGARAWEVREERKRIVMSCMRQRGHRVVG